MIILDTNILYYITEIVKTKPHDMDIKKLRAKIIMENVFISELSIMEFCVHFMNDINIIKYIFQKLRDLEITIAVYPHNRNGDIKERLLPSNILETDKDEEEIRKLIVNTLELRVEIESQFLLFLGINMATIYLGTKIYPDNKKFSEETINLMRKNTLNANRWIMGENNKLAIEIKHILKQYYKDKSGINLKDKIQYFLVDICKYYFEMYYASLTECDFMEYKNNVLSNERQNIINEYLGNDNFYKKLISFKPCDKLISSFLLENIDYNMEFYRKALSRNFSEITIMYYSKLLSKIFMNKKKLEKNCIIDSLLLNYYPKYLLITNDIYLNDHIKSFDANYYTKTRQFLKG